LENDIELETYGVPTNTAAGVYKPWLLASPLI